jgi:hypothetical protein
MAEEVPHSIKRLAMQLETAASICEMGIIDGSVKVTYSSRGSNIDKESIHCSDWDNLDIRAAKIAKKLPRESSRYLSKSRVKGLEIIIAASELVK